MGARYRVVPRENGGWDLVTEVSTEPGVVDQTVSVTSGSESEAEQELGKDTIPSGPTTQGGAAAE